MAPAIDCKPFLRGALGSDVGLPRYQCEETRSAVERAPRMGPAGESQIQDMLVQVLPGSIVVARSAGRAGAISLA